MAGTLALYAEDSVIAAGVATYGNAFNVGYSTAAEAITSQEILLGTSGSAAHAYNMKGSEIATLGGGITANEGVVFSHTIAWDVAESAFVLATTKDGTEVQTEVLGATYTLNKISFVTDGSPTSSPALSGLTLAVTTPVPATATLSLLALAALATRRKRC